MKPCPFCSSLNLRTVKYEDGWQVECCSCLARGPVSKGTFAGGDENSIAIRNAAISAWNERK